MERKRFIWDLCKMDYGNGMVQSYEPYPAMLKVHESKARFKILAVPNRAGKSLAATAEAVVRMADPRGGIRIWMAAEEYAIADNEWIYLEDMLLKTPLYDDYIIPEIQKQMAEKGITGKSPHRFIKNASSQAPKKITINWPNGLRSIIEQKSYKNSSQWKRVEGSKLHMLIFPEGSTIPADLWDAHLDMRLADLAGEVWLPATPKGEDQTMYPWFVKGLTKKMVVDIDYDNQEVEYHLEEIAPGPYHISRADNYVESYESWQFHGSESPYYNMEYYEARKHRMFDGDLSPAVFLESQFGAFASKTGKFFDNTPEFVFTKKRRIHPHATHFETVDIGASAPCAVLRCAIEPPDEDGKEKIIVYHEFYKAGLWVGTPGMDDFDNTLAGTILRHRVELGVSPEYTVVDPISAKQHFANSPKTVEQLLYEAGVQALRLPRMDRNKLLWYHKLKNAFISGRIEIFEDECPNLVREHRIAEFAQPDYERGQKIIKEELAKKDDHALTALIYFIYTNPFWRKPEHLIRSEMEAGKPEKGSMLSALSVKRSRSPYATLNAKIGSY